jgi:hypothetical protein
MADLSIVTAVETSPEGDWIAPGGDMDDIEFLTVGFNDRYTDAQATAHRRLARAYGDDLGRVPVALLRKANLECLVKMIFEPKYKPLGDGMFAAARLATSRRAADLEDAEGNSVRSSDTSSNGAHTNS